MKYLVLLSAFILGSVSCAKQTLKEESTRKPASADHYYKGDIVALCMKWTGATHPPCNETNDTYVMISHIKHNCKGNAACIAPIQEVCKRYSLLANECDASKGLDSLLKDIAKNETKEASDKFTDYWTDIEALCMQYSGATHPPCNRTNGAKMILDEVQRNCGDKQASCKLRAVEICTQYSGATRPPCNASNPMATILDHIAQQESSYRKDVQVKKKKVAPKSDKHGSEGSRGTR